MLRCLRRRRRASWRLVLRLEVDRAARVDVERGVLDEREVARPALVRRSLGDGMPAPALDVRVRRDEVSSVNV